MAKFNNRGLLTAGRGYESYNDFDLRSACHAMWCSLYISPEYSYAACADSAFREMQARQHGARLALCESAPMRGRPKTAVFNRF